MDRESKNSQCVTAFSGLRGKYSILQIYQETRELTMVALIVLALCGCDRPAGLAGSVAGESSGGGLAHGIELADISPGLSVRLQAVRRLAAPDPGVATSGEAASVIWASGVEGVWARSLDSGRSWIHGRISAEGGASATAPPVELQFRDLHAIDGQRAWLLAAGEGPASRIYATDDGGETWRLQFQNERPAAFYDCFDFWDESRAVLFSDAIPDPSAPSGFRWLLRRTLDGAEWQEIDPGVLPEATEGEGGFAASGDCVVTLPPNPGLASETASERTGSVMVALGNSPSLRFLRSDDSGASWRVIETGIEVKDPPGGLSYGLTALAFAPAGGFGIAVGGHIGAADSLPLVLITRDGGESFERATPPPLQGALYGVDVALVPGDAARPVDGDGDLWIVAVGPGGVAVSYDLARSWSTVSELDTWSVDLSADGRGVMVGPEGRVTLLELVDFDLRSGPS
jgi:photosystem II stability/assembly factor-like uncharacterized protein